MKRWFTALELAGVNGMPTSPSAVVRRAKREKWLAKWHNGQGGGKEYSITSLPSETQAALHFKHAPVPAISKDKELVVREKVDMKLTDLKEWQRTIFHARLALYREFEKLQKINGTNAAIEAMVSMAKNNDLPENLMQCVARANARKGESRTLSRSLVLSWNRAVKRYGISALAPKSMEKEVVPEWAGFFVKCYNVPMGPTIPEAMEQMAKILPAGMRMPSYHQVLRWHNKRSELDAAKGRLTGSSYRAKKGHIKRDVSGYRPFEIGQCDGHSFKAYVAHPVHGRPFHPEVCGVIDVATKMCMGWSAGLAESALTVASAFRHAATVNDEKKYGGIFQVAYTDGGSGNTAKINIDDTTGLFARIGTMFQKGRPGNPEGRGTIEVTNKSLWIRAAKQLPTCTASTMDQGAKRNMYIALHKDMRDQGKSDLLISWRDFLSHCQESVYDYNMRPHTSLPKIKDQETGLKRHMCPAECFAWHIADGWDPTACQLSEAEVEILWLPRETRKVVKATVQLGNNHYFNRDLEHYDGRDVQVAYFPTDAGKVQVWDNEGRLICYALYEKNLVDFFPKAMMERAADQRAKRRAEIKKLGLQEIYDEQRGVIEIISKPKPVADIIPIQQKQEAKKVEAAKQQLVEKMQQAPAFEVPHDDRGKYRLWQALDAQIARGEALEETAMRFYEAYRQTTSFRAFRKIEEQLSVREA
ncbi:MAG: Mu transposase C-terminal domain-containing protein [Desulfobulbus sp.]|nr:Mu transposase C-terminal domain-containing protein [Desulfobulbus sp.]